VNLSFVLPACVFVSVFAVFACAQEAKEAEEKWSDPAPPEVRKVPEEAAELIAEGYEGLTFHAAAKPRAASAINAEWHRFLGPNDDGTTPETNLLSKFPDSGLSVVWEMEKGTAYTSPVIADGRLVFFTRFEDRETIMALDPQTGKKFWQQDYAVEYRDRYGFNNGPRASAVIDDGKVYTLGVTSVLSCLDLKSGTVLWRRDLDAEFEVEDYFFGHGACPIVHGGKVIVNLGGADGLCVAAFDQQDGKLVWGTRHEWRASYASPIVKQLRGEDRLLVFAGGDSRPAVGGLLCIDPNSGELLDEFSWRSDKYESVNGSTPIVVGDNRVYISDCYSKGGVMLELGEDLKWMELWQAADFGLHWNTPQLLDGYLYGFRGRNEPDAWLACYSAQSGEEKWRDDLQWNVKVGDSDYRMAFFRGSILQADGRFYCLGELGSFAVLAMDSTGVQVTSRAQLFTARSTWSLPVVSNGLLYLMQHEDGYDDSSLARMICYDLRAGE
jgi:outer membrane protein assembly factor BamB